MVQRKLEKQGARNFIILGWGESTDIGLMNSHFALRNKGNIVCMRLGQEIILWMCYKITSSI
jgi:hypothetical protein